MGIYYNVEDYKKRLEDLKEKINNNYSTYLRIKAQIVKQMKDFHLNKNRKKS
jgi:hypothetical protein